MRTWSNNDALSATLGLVNLFLLGHQSLPSWPLADHPPANSVNDPLLCLHSPDCTAFIPPNVVLCCGPPSTLSTGPSFEVYFPTLTFSTKFSYSLLASCEPWLSPEMLLPQQCHWSKVPPPPQTPWILGPWATSAFPGNPWLPPNHNVSAPMQKHPLSFRVMPSAYSFLFLTFSPFCKTPAF